MSLVPNVDEIAWLRDNSPAWRLLRADNAPLVLGFLQQVFVTDNIRSISATELASRLDDELYVLNHGGSEGSSRRFPKPAKAYLDDWAAPGAGWLRKYYPEGTDEPHYDATPAVEKALQWIQSLGERDFVGTESRLKVIFELLRQIVFGTETDPDQRLAELLRQRQEIDEQIARVEAGDMPVLDETSVRDRYQQLAATARELLADFREVEENFRKLDRQLREKIAGWQGGKGELLDDVLGSRESIAGSDQGRSFQAFYGFLLSQARQEELSAMLEQVHLLTGIAERDPRLRHIHYDWLDAAERTQATVRQLSEQLRRFLDDQIWFENRRCGCVRPKTSR
jgi:flagellar motility protein MotE (MotC chaperone)